MRKREWTPDRADCEAVIAHLFYEVQMTFFLAEQLAAPTGTRVDLSLRNAQIEAFTFHLRQLVEFFWGERRRTASDRAAFAADFCRAGEWARARPAQPRILGHVAGLHDARLTYEGKWREPLERVWDAVSQAYALAPVVETFLDTVDRSLFTPDYLVGMRSWLSQAA